MTPAPGDVYRFRLQHPDVASYSTLRPLWHRMVVMHNDGQNVHYRMEWSGKIKHTPRERFLACAEQVDKECVVA